MFEFNEFWPLQSLFENLEVHWDSNSQSGSSLGSVRAHSLTLSCTPGSMKCDSQAHSWLTPLQTFALVANPRLGLWQLQPVNSIKSQWNHLAYKDTFCYNVGILITQRRTLLHQSLRFEKNMSRNFLRELKSWRREHQLIRDWKGVGGKERNWSWSSHQRCRTRKMFPLNVVTLALGS
jgi:hypothetical protein